jgi:hypothetical protein
MGEAAAAAAGDNLGSARKGDAMTEPFAAVDSTFDDLGVGMVLHFCITPVVAHMAVVWLVLYRTV